MKMIVLSYLATSFLHIWTRTKVDCKVIFSAPILERYSGLAIMRLFYSHLKIKLKFSYNPAKLSAVAALLLLLEKSQFILRLK